jgi:hypothetical protein
MLTDACKCFFMCCNEFSFVSYPFLLCATSFLKCYYFYDASKVDIEQANEFNLCKFVADELHNHLSNGKYTKWCLLYCMVSFFFIISFS